MIARILKNLAASIFLLLLAQTAVVQAQTIYTTNNYSFNLNADGGWTIFLYTGPSGAVSIPAAINFNGLNLPVTRIGAPFTTQSGVTNVFIPGSVMQILDYAFNNSELTSVTIPNTVTNLGVEVFYNCVNLTSVDVNSTTVGTRDFYGCSSLTNVWLGDNVIRIGTNAFALCTNLTSLTIPINVTNIEDSPFKGCSSLSQINIQNSIIGGTEFAGCTGLTNFTIPANVTNVGTPPYPYIYSIYTPFAGCTNLVNVTIKNSLVADYEFWGVSSLTNVTLTTAVTSIGTNAFRECYGLTSIVIPDGVNKIGDQPFYGCTNLAEAAINNGFVADFQFNYCPALASVTLLGVNSIGHQAFANCPLTDITIPNTVTHIGEGAFAGCPLFSVTIPASVTSMEDDVFLYDPLTSVTILNKVIGGFEFYGCSNLTSVIIPDTVTNIGTEAFIQCYGLTNLIIGNGVTTIQSGAFEQCYALKNLVLGQSVASIGEDAFAYCTSLNSVTFPGSLTNLDGVTFDGCTNLNYVCFQGNKPGGPNNGLHNFGLAPLDVIYIVQGTTGWSGTFDNNGNGPIPTTTCEECGLGFLTVNLAPADAVNAGAHWSVDGTNWLNSGNTLSNLVAKNYTVRFSAVAGWIAPAKILVAIHGKETTVTNATYTPPSGSLRVTITPSVAVTAGAKWAVDGGIWRNSGVTVAGLPSGNHTVGFKPVFGWTPPTNQPVIIPAAKTTSLTATYFPVTNQLNITIVGLGTVSPNLNNAWLQLGKKYTITAKPAKGFAFQNWSGGSSQPFTILSTKAGLTFPMQSNLTLVATMRETSRPTLTITNPANNTRTSTNTVLIVGRASDVWLVTGVNYSVNGGSWSAVDPASSYTNWSATATLSAGTNLVRVYAQNLGGLYSLTNSLKIIATNQVVLNLRVLGWGNGGISTKAVPAVASPNTFTLGVDLAPGSSGRIEYSTDLIHWTGLTNFSATSQSFTFEDHTATNTDYRFYRAVSP